MPPSLTLRRSRPSGRRSGFTLIELLVVVAIVGIIAVILIPNFINSLHKAKQKRTMAEIHETGKAMLSWLTGQMGGAAAGTQALDVSSYGDAVEVPDLTTLLVPDYIARVPERDAWGHDLEYFLRTDNLLAGRVMLIRSPGMDGAFSESSYKFSSFPVTEFDQDIVWADGFFVRWPLGAAAAGPR